MPVKKEISLLPDQENNSSLVSKVLRYSTTVGRVVIIFTELIVISAFISRFWLDRKNSDLSEVIRQQTAILQSTQEFEKEYTQLQQKLAVIKKYYSQQPQYKSNLTSLVESTPPDIIYNNLTMSKNKDTHGIESSITVIAYQEDSIVNFLTNLIVNPDIKSISLDSIEKKSKDNKYSINIKVEFKTSKT